jgi:phenylpropionate dioxygenase-like ring-hydroxylating dioxygenase large terminal subunit
MTYLANTWYAAAWAEELGDALLPRRIADQPIVLFRDDDGKLVALEDRCPHRFAPLSLGRRVGSTIACGYHGLTFNAAGACVHNPFSSTIPPKAKVRSYPAVERNGLVWLWLGDEAAADPSLIRDFSVLESDEWRPANGYMHVKVNYEILIDNLMDLSHAEFVHPTNLGVGGLATGDFKVRHDGDAVSFILATPETLAPPVFDFIQNSDGKPVFFTVTGRWDAPGIVDLQSTTEYPGSPREQHVTFKGIHIVVPETEFSSHYFYSGLRNVRMDDEELQVAIEAGLKLAFEQEDKPMVEAAQANMSTTDLLALDPVLLPLDGAAVRVRKRLRKMIAAEQGDKSAPIEDWDHDSTRASVMAG